MKFFEGKKRLFIITSLTIILLLLISSTTFVFFPNTAKNIFSYVTAPIQQGVATINDFFSNSKSELLAENEQLKAENEQLKLDNSRLDSLNKDNQELSDLLGTKQKFSQYDTIAARKIGQNFNNWNNSIIIDKGSADGIAVDMVVIAEGALVGKVTSVTPHTANVTTILDDSSSISAVTSRSNNIAFVNGDIDLVGTDTCSLEYLDSTTPIFENDELFTSSISSLYPPGISIGFVKEVSTNKDNETTAVVEPIVDFDNLDTVLVIDQVFSETIDVESETEE